MLPLKAYAEVDFVSLGACWKSEYNSQHVLAAAILVNPLTTMYI